VPITTKVVSSNQVHGKVYLIPLYEIKFVNDLWQVVGFLRVLWVSLTDKKYCHDTQVLFFFLRYKLEGKSLFFVNWGTCCAFILNLVNKKGLPVWKLAYSFSVYIILPENTHQYLFAAADNSPWKIFHSLFAIFRRHF
jgi:hypothetical protein